VYRLRRREGLAERLEQRFCLVDDSPEGLAISPKGNIPKSDWYYHPHGLVTVLKIDGKKVTG
jgi:hypothetical protein